MATTTNNPMAEYLLKLQLIVTNTEFKNSALAREHETVETRTLGDKYVRAMTGNDSFNDYDYNNYVIIQKLHQRGYSDDMIQEMYNRETLIPYDIRMELYEEEHNRFISNYIERNPYYARLAGIPFAGSEELAPDEIISIPDEFYQAYAMTGEVYRGEPIHEMSDKYQELFMNSKYYAATLAEHPDSIYLKYIGSNKIPIEISRSAADASIMRINTSKLSVYHDLFGMVSVTPDVIHQFTNVYNKTREYVFYTLRGEFSDLYANYDSFMRFLTIYLSIGNCLSYFMKSSTELRIENNSIANNFFVLYGLPSVVMESNETGEFLKKFRQILMDKGTNVVYRVKDIIGYEYTDIYTLVMVKQQKFENGRPLFKTLEDGTTAPVQEVVFRRLGTTEDNTSYFKFRDSDKTYTVDEITSGDPRWWNTPEVEAMIQDMNYTLSNSKYIQLSTHVSFTDIWWECVMMLRTFLDNREESINTPITINYKIDDVSSYNLFEVVLMLIVLMNRNLVDVNGRTMDGTLFVNNGYDANGVWSCLDILFDGFDANGKPKTKLGAPFKVSSFNWNFRTEHNAFYQSIEFMDYINTPRSFKDMLDNVLDRQNMSLGDAATKEARDIYDYLVDKIRSASTISEFRQATEILKRLFLVDPVRKWYDESTIDTDTTLLQIYEISEYDLASFKYFWDEGHTDFTVKYNLKTYNICLHDVMNTNVYDINFNGEYMFRENDFVEAFEDAIDKFTSKELERSGLSDTVRLNYRSMIKDKVALDLSATENGPTSFDKLLMRENVQIYRYIKSIEDKPETVVMMIKAIIKGLESYTNTNLGGLEMSALGQEKYIDVIKEVISYFKSYMVEFTKEEFVYIFGGTVDNGGNSDMLNLFDEIAHAEINLLPKDALTMYDVSRMQIQQVLADDNRGMIYDDALFRLKGTYQNLLNTGYEIVYDDGYRITKTPPEGLETTDEVVADIIYDEPSSAYKIIINVKNITTDDAVYEDDSDDTWYGNAF